MAGLPGEADALLSITRVLANIDSTRHTGTRTGTLVRLALVA